MLTCIRHRLQRSSLSTFFPIRVPFPHHFPDLCEHFFCLVQIFRYPFQLCRGTFCRFDEPCRVMTETSWLRGISHYSDRLRSTVRNMKFTSVSVAVNPTAASIAAVTVATLSRRPLLARRGLCRIRFRLLASRNVCRRVPIRTLLPRRRMALTSIYHPGIHRYAV